MLTFLKPVVIAVAFLSGLTFLIVAGAALILAAPVVAAFKGFATSQKLRRKRKASPMPMTIEGEYIVVV